MTTLELTVEERVALEQRRALARVADLLTAAGWPGLAGAIVPAGASAASVARSLRDHTRHRARSAEELEALQALDALAAEETP